MVKSKLLNYPETVAKLKNLIISDDFKTWINPLHREQLDQLRENIETEGIRDALVVWKERNILIDGHNRFQIIQDLKLPLESIPVEYKSFTSDEDVKDWMIRNQLGRRNLNSNELSYLRGKLYNREKKKQGGQKGNSNYSGKDEGIKLNHSSTADKLAKDFSVTSATIKRDEAFSNGLDRIGQKNPKLKNEILSGETKVSKADIQKIGKLKDIDSQNLSIAKLNAQAKVNAEKTLQQSEHLRKLDIKEEFRKNLNESTESISFEKLKVNIQKIVMARIVSIEDTLPEETQLLLGLVNDLHQCVKNFHPTP
ncbi:ParB N-terminal domain-containing protein [Persicobacter diffluens]|uniref:ParB/Sulfiredoxin domain-containing protein n=1 Tax=Persicobacter diffluens TaxID=981 RepID=A0AAN5APT5_9BACT|nr:hypothetical protein PEDI_51980 [Persicobacter diffluens]